MCGFTASFVQTEGEFVQIALKMLSTEPMINIVETTLQNSSDTFNAIGMGHIVHKLLCAMVDDLMCIFLHPDI